MTKFKFKRKPKQRYHPPERTKSKVHYLAGEAQKFMLRVSFSGVLSFICPACGTKNVKRMTVFTWWVRCTGSIPMESVGADGEALTVMTSMLKGRGRQIEQRQSCKRVYIPFLGLVPLGLGRRLPPRDHIVPDDLQDAYPLGEYIREPRWLSGDPVHRVDLHPSFCCLHKRYCDKIDLQSTSENENAREDPTR